MNTSNENNEYTINGINENCNYAIHKLSVMERRSIRPNTSVKRSLFKVKSLRLGKFAARKTSEKVISKLENSKV